MDLNEIKNDAEINALLAQSEKQLKAMGYTEHSARHRSVVTARTARILKALGSTDEEIERGKIAAFLHDVGCAVSRENHAQNGALLVLRLLTARNMNVDDVCEIANAVGNHDEKTGFPCSRIAAALVLADKSDVHFKRVRREKQDEQKLLAELTDIHNRVNYAVKANSLKLDKKNKVVSFVFTLNADVSSPMEYFEIFLGRMKMCKHAATQFGWTFRLVINGHILA